MKPLNICSVFCWLWFWNSKCRNHFVLVKGSFFAPSQRFLANNLVGGNAANIILSRVESPYICWNVRQIFSLGTASNVFIFCFKVRPSLGLPCLKSSIFIFVTNHWYYWHYCFVATIMAELEEELFKGERECKQNISSFLKKKNIHTASWLPNMSC